MARILVIDDEASIRSVLRRILVREGHEVVEAENGAKGANCFRETPFDLVITDIFMPEKDGLEVLMEMRREHPGVRIIAISGGGRHGMLDYLTAAEKLGAVGSIAKPFNFQQIVEGVRKALG